MKEQKVKKIWAQPNVISPAHPVVYDIEKCNGCNLCVEACPMDVFIPNPEKRKVPLIIYPDECWYCGCCVLACPRPGAIKSNFPLTFRVPWKRKATGKHSWAGMKTKPS